LEDYTPFLYVEKIGGTGGTDGQADGVQNSMLSPMEDLIINNNVFLLNLTLGSIVLYNHRRKFEAK